MNRMNDFDLNLLRVFEAVWRHRHLGQASRELNVSQPALSHSLKRLRARIGDPLFMKVPDGMQPTARAAELAPVIRSMLTSLRETVLTAPDFDPKSVTRTFTIAMTDIGEVDFLPKLLNVLMSAAPSVKIHSVSMLPRDLTAAMQRSSVDLALGYFPDIDGADFLQHRLFRRGYVCVVRAGHPVVHGRLSARQFRELPHAVVQTTARSQEAVQRYLDQHRVLRREVLRSPHYLSIPRIIASTDLVVLVPESLGLLLGQFAELQVLPPPYPIPSFDIKQYWHRSQHGDPGNRWLRSVVLDLFLERSAECAAMRHRS
jgi:DNA-binding transcriptional LysR family regulator